MEQRRSAALGGGGRAQLGPSFKLKDLQLRNEPTWRRFLAVRSPVRVWRVPREIAPMHGAYDPRGCRIRYPDPRSRPGSAAARAQRRFEVGDARRDAARPPASRSAPDSRGPRCGGRRAAMPCAATPYPHLTHITLCKSLGATQYCSSAGLMPHASCFNSHYRLMPHPKP